MADGPWVSSRDELGNELGSADGPADPGRRRGTKGWRPTWVTAAVVVVALAAGAIGYVKWESRPQIPKWCAGVGLFGPPASSPRAAFDAWRASDVSQPPSSAWRQHGDTFVNTAYAPDNQHAFQSVQVERGGPLSIPRPLPSTVWTVQGGCV